LKTLKDIGGSKKEVKIGLDGKPEVFILFINNYLLNIIID